MRSTEPQRYTRLSWTVQCRPQTSRSRSHRWRYGGKTVIGKIVGYEATNYQGDSVDLYEVEYPDGRNGHVSAERIMAFVPDETYEAGDILEL